MLAAVHARVPLPHRCLCVLAGYSITDTELRLALKKRHLTLLARLDADTFAKV